MNRCVLVLGMVVASAAGLAAQNPNYDPDWFNKLNPGYVKRSGEFYENKYLPGAVLNMTKAANHPALTQEKAEALLKGHIYRFLTLYVEGNGSLTNAERDQMTRQFDLAVMDVLKNEAAFQRFSKWRATTSREENPLEFLFNPPQSLSIKLSDDLMKAGWALQNITDVNQLEQYKALAGFAPDQVLHFTNAKVKNGFLTLFVYPTERIALMKVKKGPNANGKLDPSLKVFWQLVNNHVMYAKEGNFAKGQAELAAHVRNQLLGN